MEHKDYLKSKPLKDNSKSTEFNNLFNSGDKIGLLKFYFKNSPVYFDYKQTKTYDDCISLIKSNDDERSRRFAKISDSLDTISIYCDLSTEPVVVQDLTLFKSMIKLR